MLKITVLFTLFVAAFGGVVPKAIKTGREIIVGGREANVEDYPYQVAVEYRSGPWCGGSIISKDWVLTAAHCIHKRETADFRCRAGSSLSGSGGSIHNAERIIEHEKYQSFIYNHDYALIKVAEPFDLNGGLLKAITLASATPPAGSVLTVTGWGSLYYVGPYPTHLRVVEVFLVDHDSCKAAYPWYNPITKYMVCAGVPHGGKDACQGDSGGPLVSEEGQLVGVVSWGNECALADYPGVYADVAAAREWIKTNSGV